MRALVNSTAHEFMESITDPNFDGWGSLPATEVGDPCDWLFQSSVPLSNSRWKVQEIWSNLVNGCAQGSGQEVRISGAFSDSGVVATFDIPGATYGIFATSINAEGDIPGYYYVSNDNGSRGFVRTKSGVITAIGGFPRSINQGGSIAGTSADANGTPHGFVRNPDGAITTFDAPGASNAGVESGTTAYCINSEGRVTGSYFDANFVAHGYVRDRQGNFVTFSVSGASNAGVGNGTFARSINTEGAVAGSYTDARLVRHGFVRDPAGKITTFNVPGSLNGTVVYSINDEGAIAGYYTDALFVKHGFVRDEDGTFTTFDAPGAAYGTIASSINGAGAVAGYYSDAEGISHGFVRDAYGHFTTFDTIPQSINDKGNVAGYVTKVLP